MHILLHVTEPDFRRLVEAGDIAVPTTAPKQTSKRLVASRSTTQSRAAALWTAQDLDRVWAAKQAWRVSDRRYCATALELAEMRKNTLVPRAFDWRRDASRPQNFGEFARHTLDMKHRSPRALLNAGLRVDHERRVKVRAVQTLRAAKPKNSDTLAKTASLVDRLGGQVCIGAVNAPQPCSCLLRSMHRTILRNAKDTRGERAVSICSNDPSSSGLTTAEMCRS